MFKISNKNNIIQIKMRLLIIPLYGLTFNLFRNDRLRGFANQTHNNRDGRAAKVILGAPLNNFRNPWCAVYHQIEC